MICYIFLYCCLFSIIECAQDSRESQATEFIVNPIQTSYHQNQKKIEELYSTRNKLYYADKQNSMMYSAIIGNDEELFDAVFVNASEEKLKFKNYRQKTLIHTAIACRRHEMFEKLMSRNVIDLDAQAYDGQTVTHYAVLHNNLYALDSLDNYGANFGIKDDEGLTPFMLSVKLGRNDIIDGFLAMKQSCMHTKDSYGNRPLHYVQSKSVVKKLVERGANIHVRGRCGHTPIVIAAINHRIDVVRALLAYGAQADYVDSRGKNILELIRQPKKGITDLLVQAGVNPFDENGEEFRSTYDDKPVGHFPFSESHIEYSTRRMEFKRTTSAQKELTKSEKQLPSIEEEKAARIVHKKKRSVLLDEQLIKIKCEMKRRSDLILKKRADKDKLAESNL